MTWMICEECERRFYTAASREDDVEALMEEGCHTPGCFGRVRVMADEEVQRGTA